MIPFAASSQQRRRISPESALKDNVGPAPAKTALRGPLSIERVFGILVSIAGDAHGKSLTQLSQELSTPKTSLLNLLPRLTTDRYLTRDKDRYRLGPQAFDFARAILRSRQDLAGLARPLLQRLAADTDKTVTMCVLAPDKRAVLHIVKEESRAAMRFMVQEGHRAPLHTTAAGRVMLAFFPGEWVDHFFGHARLSQHTRYTITDRAQLRASVREVRKQGYAVTRGETYETVGAVAAPVFGSEGFIGAVVVAGAVEQVVAQLGTLAPLVRGAADELSVLLGQTQTLKE